MPPLSYRPVLSPFAVDLRIGAKNRPDQVKRLNDALYSVGHGDREVAEAPLDQQVLDGKAANQLTQFQKNMGLEPDGWVAPKGPTYKALNMLSAGAITGAVPNGKDQSDWLKSNFGLAGLVGQPPANGGNAGPFFNRPDDRLKVTNALGLYLPGKKLGLSQLDQPLSGEALGKALGDYEKANQLPVSGQAAPGGKTWTHLLGKIGTWVKDLPFGDAKTYAELTTPDPDKLHRILAGVKAEREERKPQVQVLKFADGVAEEKEFQNLRRALAEGKLDPHKGTYSREEIAAASGELMGHGGAKVSGQLRTTQRQPPDEDREAQASTPAGPQVAQAEEEVRPSNAEMRAKDFPQNILDLFDLKEDQAKWDAPTKGFYHALNKTLAHEKGWSTDANGTWRGVSQNFYDAFREREADNPQYADWPQYVGNLNEAQVANLYLTEFYQRPRYDRLAEVPGLRGEHAYLLEQVFDAGVNSSPRQSSELFKQAINAVLSKNLDDYQPIETGRTRIDDETVAALTRADSLGLLDEINNEMANLRIAFISDSDKINPDMRDGLLKRAWSFWLWPKSQ